MKKFIISIILAVAMLAVFAGCNNVPERIDFTKITVEEITKIEVETIEETEATEPIEVIPEKETFPEVPEGQTLVEYYRQEIKARMGTEKFITVEERDFFERNEYQVISEKDGTVKWLNPNFLTDCYHAILIEKNEDILVVYSNRYGFISTRNITSGGKDGYDFVHTSADNQIVWNPEYGITFDAITGTIDVWKYGEVVEEKTIVAGSTFVEEATDGSLTFQNGNETIIVVFN